MLEKVITSVAWGGCSATLAAKYSIVCHAHMDHIVKDRSITVVGPVAFLKRDNKLCVDPNTWTKIRINDTVVKITVVGKRWLRALGVTRKLHCYPVLVEAGDEVALYIDDFDVADVEEIKKLIKNLKASLGERLRFFLMPVYSGTNGHGVSNPKELAEKSKELMLFAMAERLEVVALAHPTIPSWVPENVRKLYKVLPTCR